MAPNLGRLQINLRRPRINCTITGCALNKRRPAGVSLAPPITGQWSDTGLTIRAIAFRRCNRAVLARHPVPDQRQERCPSSASVLVVVIERLRLSIAATPDQPPIETPDLSAPEPSEPAS
jgi:hypothetical protein